MKIVFNCREGFFCALTWALYCWRHAEETKQKIRVEVNGAYGQNYLDRYISQTDDADTSKTITVNHFRELKFPSYLFTRRIAHDLFSRHAEIRRSVLDEADMFTVTGFLGAHYRGTDKYNESKPITFPKFCAKVEEYRRSRNFNGIFFSTDVRDLTMAGDDVIQRKDDFRSDNEYPVHKTCSGNLKNIGLDAIVNCLLMSRCRALVRTCSHLSAWAGIFNPNLDIVTVNQMSGRASFPEGSTS